MKAIILAAWEGTRLKPITNTIPKPLIKIVWKTIIEHNLESIYKDVDEIIIVVKYLKEKFSETIWDNYKWTKITYTTQIDEKGTAAAIKNINISWNFLLLNWDSIFDKLDLKKIISLKWYWALVQETTTPEKYGIFKEKDWKALEIIEKPKEFVWKLANLWVYKFNDSIFKIIDSIPLSPRWEYEITDAINEFIKNNEFNLLKINWDFIDIGYPWDILKANSYFLNKLEKPQIQWEIEENVTIKWNIILEKWAILKSETYIEWNCYIGKNTTIWPNIYIRWNTSIWNNCKLWANNEIKNTHIWDNTNIAHLSYIWDSIIWNNVNIWGWFITANLRHDWNNIKVPVKWILTDTWLHKLWVIIWDNVKTWIKAYSMPWRVIENNTIIMPWEIIK